MCLTQTCVPKNKRKKKQKTAHVHPKQSTAYLRYRVYIKVPQFFFRSVACGLPYDHGPPWTFGLETRELMRATTTYTLHKAIPTALMASPASFFALAVSSFFSFFDSAFARFAGSTGAAAAASASASFLPSSPPAAAARMASTCFWASAFSLARFLASWGGVQAPQRPRMSWLEGRLKLRRQWARRKKTRPVHLLPCHTYCLLYQCSSFAPLYAEETFTCHEHKARALARSVARLSSRRLSPGVSICVYLLMRLRDSNSPTR